MNSSFLKMLYAKSQFICVGLFFIFLMLLGLFIHKDYGPSIDDFMNRQRGIVTLNYLGNYFQLPLIQQNHELLKYKSLPDLPNYIHRGDLRFGDAEHGPFFAELAVSLERIFNIGGLQGDLREILHFHHLLSYFAVLLGVFAIFAMAKRRFNDWRIGLLSAVFFTLSPRLFAESFYNVNDLVFLSLCAISLNQIILLLFRPSIFFIILAGLTSALAIDIRIMGIIFIPITIFVLLILFLNKNLSKTQFLKYLILYFASLILVIFLFWPWLWISPVNNFISALALMSHVNQSGTFLYFGDFVTNSKIPWHYLPSWIGLTTPPFYLFLWTIGFFITLRQLVVNNFLFWKDINELQDLIFLAFFIFPILLIILMNSVIFDGWRHVYFIYPAFLLTATKGWVYLFYLVKKLMYLKIFLVLILISSILSTSYILVKFHPYQNVYFNFFAGTDWKNRFDLDYWWMTSERGFEEIIVNWDKTNDRDLALPIKVYLPETKYADLNHSLDAMQLKFRNRIQLVNSPLIADYIFTNYRYTPKNYFPDSNVFSRFTDISIDGEIISSIFIRNEKFKVQLNKSITFNKNGSGVPYLISGWGFPEDWGVWSVAETGKLIVPFPKTKFQSLTITLYAFVNPLKTRQEVNFRIGKIERSIVLNDGKWRSISLPLSIDEIHSGYIEIAIDVKNPISPQNLGISDDSRRLGIGLISLEFN